ncbi:MAG: adenosine kinase [Rickettsia endosymbiont of Sceptobius lativentris]|nr:adenosine kinase [Rickettsia endosymbiont of Sceptobius lativentris]
MLKNICFILSFLLLSHTSYAVIDKCENHQWQSKKNDILAVGQAVYDIIYKFDDEEKHLQYLKSVKVPKGESVVISKDIAAKISKDLKPISKQLGGSVNNTAAGLANLGTRVSFLGSVAYDNLGKQYIEAIEKYRIYSLIRKVNSSKETGVVNIIISPDGERTMLAYPGISRDLPPLDYKIILLEGYLWHEDGDDDALKEFLHIAKNNEVITAFTFGSYEQVKKYRKKWSELIKEIDIIFSDREQIYALFKNTNWDEVVNNLQKYDTIFVVTDNKNGAHIIYRDQKIYIPAYNIKYITDTTGAGDQFAAGFLYGFLNNYDLEKCGQFGTKTAAKIIQQIGAKPLKITKLNSEKFLFKQYTLK